MSTSDPSPRSIPEPRVTEETLDPQDWEAQRQLAHRMVDDAFDWLASVRERPVWRPVPDDVAAALREPLPRESQSADAVYREFTERILPYPMGNVHPRFWGWYMGAGSAAGALGAFWEAMLNINLGGGDHVGTHVEQLVVDWCAELVGFPEGSGGLMTSGASVANLVGLAVARRSRARGDVRQTGVGDESLVFYGSSETHSCHLKAADLLGLGRSAFRAVAVDAAYRLDLTALERELATDRAAGRTPFCVVANAGTINTGAVDDLVAVAELCEREGLWFHVDGAIGAAARIAPSLAPQLAGLERADSVALDLHKWMHVPFEAGVALVRDREAHRHTFALRPDYLEYATRGLGGGDTWFSDYGVQLSRGFKALRVWMAFKEHGTDKLGRLMEMNVAQAHHLADRVEREAALELGAPVGLDIVCLRYRTDDASDAELDALNRELLIRLHESGVAVPSYTTLNGRYWLRVAISNHRTTFADIDLFVDTLLELGDALRRESTGSLDR